MSLIKNLSILFIFSKNLALGFIYFSIALFSISFTSFVILLISFFYYWSAWFILFLAPFDLDHLFEIFLIPVVDWYQYPILS